MKKKKSDKVNLDKNRLIFFEVGLIVALSFTLIAFEWAKAPSKADEGSSNLISEANLFQTEITFRKPEEKKERPKLTLIINKVDDDDLTIDQPDIFNPEIDPGDSYELWAIPEIEDEPDDEPVIFVDVKDKPLFNGGDPMIEFRKYIATHVIYPQEAIDNGVDGRVTIQFVIDKTGHVTDVKVLQGVHPALDNEAVRVIKSSPAWTPGKQRGRPVKVMYYFPVVFKLQH